MPLECLGIFSRGLRRRFRHSAAWLAAGTLFALVACSESGPPRGQLVVALDTDVPLPEDLDGVVLRIEKDKEVVFEVRPDPKLLVGPNDNRLPETLTLWEKFHSGDTLEISLRAFKADELRQASTALTRIPKDRVGVLRVQLQWLCDSAFGGPGSCGASRQCVAGACVDGRVGDDALDTYKEGRVAGTPFDGCFDTRACVADGVAVPVVRDEAEGTCLIETPSGRDEDKLNVILAVAKGNGGQCPKGAEQCFVALEKGRFGWAPQGRDILLPPAVCERLDNEILDAVVLTDACPTKTARTPLCGDWSSIETPVARFPDDDDLPFFTNPVRDDDPLSVRDGGSAPGPDAGQTIERDAGATTERDASSQPDGLDLGEVCAAGLDCKSGFCAHGVCCESSCDGMCNACDQAGLEGSCTSLPEGAPERNGLCTAQPGSECGRTGVCTDSGTCAFRAAGTSCGEGPQCQDNRLATFACDGAGACLVHSDPSCAPYACSQDMCLASCAESSDCAPGNLCADSACGAVLPESDLSSEFDAIYDAVWGPDDRFWLVGDKARKMRIGRFDPNSGALSVFGKLDDLEARSGSIIVGPDGLIWAAFGNRLMAKVFLDGSLFTIDGGDGAADPGDAYVGHVATDGTDIWYASIDGREGSDTLARMNVNGVILQVVEAPGLLFQNGGFPAPVRGVGTEMWFVGKSADGVMVGTVAPGNLQPTITNEFPCLVGTQNACFNHRRGILRDSQGGVWVTYGHSQDGTYIRQIGHLGSNKGTVLATYRISDTELDLGRGAEVDGNLWFHSGSFNTVQQGLGELIRIPLSGPREGQADGFLSPLSVNARLLFVSEGPANTLWFARNGKLFRFSP